MTPHPSPKPNPNPKLASAENPLREQVLAHLATLKIPLSAQQLDELLREATQAHSTYWQLLERLLAVPAQSYRQRGVQRRLKQARFRDPGTLESFDWDFNPAGLDPAFFRELGTGDFIRRRENVAFVGESGLGKSHLIQGVGRACCAAGYRVRYVTSAELLEELTAALADKTLSRRVKYYRSFDLLIIDEFGFDKLERREYPEAASLLYKVVDARNGRSSTALVTNIDFQDWTDYLGDPPLVMAILDRVVDNTIIQKFSGKSYRKHRAEQKAREKAARPEKTRQGTR